MGILVVMVGFVMTVPVVIFLTLCLANIILVDSLAVSVIGSVLLCANLHLHPVIGILIGAGLFAGMTYLYMQDKAFVVLTIVSSVIWAYLAGFFTYGLSRGDVLWTAFAVMITGTVSCLLHLGVKNGMIAVRGW